MGDMADVRAGAAQVASVGVVSLAAASLPQAPLSALVLSLFFYSFVGWVWESVFCALANQGRFANSGFLLGPVCPIYGVGAIACWLLFRGIASVPAQFLASAVFCCALEYLVGVALERMTGARFWNYDDKPLNIQGRVCFYGFVLFGVGVVLICRVVEPALLWLMAPVPGVALAAVAGMLVVLLVVDLVFAVASWRRLSSRLEDLRCDLALELNNQLGEASDRMLERLPEGMAASAESAYARANEAASDLVGRLAPKPPRSMDELREELGKLAAKTPAPEVSAWLSDAVEVLVAKLGKRDLRFFNAFPQLRIPRYEGIIERSGLRERVRSMFGRK